MRAPQTVRLTDQALVAVALARRSAGTTRPSVAHLLLGLATEPDGLAARVFSAHSASATRFAERVASASASLPALETALGWAARETTHRPLWTCDLLAAALEVGGTDLDELLASSGFHPQDLHVPPPESSPLLVLMNDGRGFMTETVGADPTQPTFTPAAARAIARTRAVGGGATALVVALELEGTTDPDDVPRLPEGFMTRLAALSRAEDGGWSALSPARSSDEDRGLDAVLEAARRTAPAERAVAPVDLLRAAILVGGRRPAALLAPNPEENP